MDDFSQPELFASQLKLKEQLSGIPLVLREKFILMLCERLGLNSAKDRDKLIEKLKQIFKALDAERN
jgi:hypothetical protein